MTLVNHQSHYNRKGYMKQITITSRDYAKAAAKASRKLLESVEETDARSEVTTVMMLEFLVFQNCIYEELFKEEGENYA